MGGSSIPVNSSPDGAMVCLQPRADSLRLAFWELTVYKIENLQLRGIRLTLDRALLQTARGGEGSRFLFREKVLEMMLISSFLHSFFLGSQTSHFWWQLQGKRLAQTNGNVGTYPKSWTRRKRNIEIHSWDTCHWLLCPVCKGSCQVTAGDALVAATSLC